MNWIKIYHSILNEIPQNVKLIAVSKTKPNELIQELYSAGQVCFGENKVQEVCKKYDELPKEIEWHFIGHLQTNKVKFIAPFISAIHGVDSFKLLEIINTEAIKNNRIIDCLLQLKIAKEESKFGLSENEINQLLALVIEKKMLGIRIIGLMGMATFTDDKVQIRNEFKFLKMVFDSIKSKQLNEFTDFKDLSMGMSDDYTIAIEEGSTMVRIGSLLFGERVYN